MRITAVYDRRGNIETLVAGSEDAPPPQPETKPGQYCSEISAPQVLEALREDLGDELIFRRLEEIMNSYRVDVGSAPPKLVKNSVEPEAPS
ncbi:hypothetical protein ACFOOM_27345 [Streptomyces echinoruber]|uniref:Uncharacterized protein n=1 Tax=Streptomyces echinoruber TaxID=68898 RepID=A0A918QXC7_9ACTN|nr:hypothetical protein [Streptomyces echinoruber]GGZ75069.1 hypothetical protein GCM10010389_10610 [Streptomyces echinoruber]